MTSPRSRVLAFLVCAVGVALLSPSAVQACSCSGADPCTGKFCYCRCAACLDEEPDEYPCPSVEELAFAASQEELAAFKDQIDEWSTRKELQTVVEAATELYDSVLFQDRQSYRRATSNYKKAISALPEVTRLTLFRGPESRPAQDN